MNNQKHLTIGRLAKELGICAETIRYYHRIGLLPIPEPLPSSTVRMYGNDDLRLVRFIKQAQRLGFCLDEIRALIALSNGSQCEQVQSLARNKLQELKKKMTEIATMHDAIAVLLDECVHRDHTTSCPIIEVLMQGDREDCRADHTGNKLH